MSGKILVTGSSGYVANYIITTMAKLYPQVTIVGLSRSGKPRFDPALLSHYPNLSYHKGDCLEPESFKDLLQDVDGCIHTVGTLIDSKDPKRSYDAMNRDTCVNVARALNESASDSKKRMVMISSAKAPPFMPKYLTTKQEAEQFILKECPQLNPLILRPGFIYNKEHRSWSIPLFYVTEAMAQINDTVGKKLPFHSAVDFLFPAAPTKLETVGHFAIEGVLGNLHPEQTILGPEEFKEFEKV